jgi:hypothetical protein
MVTIPLCTRYKKGLRGKARPREDHGASPSLWKEYCRKTRQTIQVGSGNLHVGKLNQMPQEKNISPLEPGRTIN